MYRPKYTSSFLICANLNDSQTFKSSCCKNGFLQCVCHRCNLLRSRMLESFLLRWMVFVPCDSWKTLFISKCLTLLWDFFNHYIAVFETSVLKEVCILRYLHNNSVVLILMLMLSSKKSYPILIHTSKTFICSWFFLW